MPRDIKNPIIWPSGVKEWVNEEGWHREDGPAFIYADGSEEWWVNGLLHRTDGPAVEWANGVRQWFIEGVQYDPTEWMLKVHEMNNG